jgi:hypothetical protein
MRSTLVSATLIAAASLRAIVPRAVQAQGSLAVGAHAAAPTDDAAPRATSPSATRAPRLTTLLLAHRGDLGLTDAQVTLVMAVAARSDLVVTPLEAEIDSLALRGGATDWARVTDEQGAILRAQVRKRSALVAAVHDELMLARAQALDALTETQQRAAVELEVAERRAEAGRLRVTRGGGWNGVNQRP